MFKKQTNKVDRPHTHKHIDRVDYPHKKKKKGNLSSFKAFNLTY